MEVRKLISFGKGSYVISIPKAWVIQNKLKKGDHVYLQDAKENLILSPQLSDGTSPETEITINIDGKTLKQIKREIIAAYINNYKTIRLLGKEIKEKARPLQHIIQGLIALEVMEQTTTSIIAKDFLNLESVSLQMIIRKLDIITRSMWSDCEKMFDEDLSENIDHRDKDVNKLSFLVFRIVRFGFENPYFTSQKFNMTFIELLQHWFVAYNLESIADEAKRVARYMQRIKLSKEKQKEYLEIIKMIRENYMRIMKAYYEKDINAVHEVLDKRMEIIRIAEEFYLANRDVNWIGYLIERTKAAAGHTTYIGRAMYQCM